MFSKGIFQKNKRKSSLNFLFQKDERRKKKERRARKRKEARAFLHFIKKHRALLLSLSIGLLVLSFFLKALFFRSFAKYPEDLQVEIAWRGFKTSFDGSCREECLAQRQFYASIWRPYYRENFAEFKLKISEAFLEGNEELEEALIKIMAVDYKSRELGPFLNFLIARTETSSEIKRLVVKFFPEYFQDELWISNLQERVINDDLEIAERVYSLSLLSSFKSLELEAIIKSILFNPSSEPGLLEEALLLLSNWEEFQLNDSELSSLLASIKKNSFLVNRWRLIWLLSEQFLNKEALKEALESLALNTLVDNISRGLAAEALRLEFNKNIITPLPSDREWQEYYEKI